MQTLREVMSEYKKAGKALGHFNFSDSNQLKAIALAAKETSLPVIAGLSEGERDFFPLSHARALINTYQEEGYPVYLNADHTYDTDKVQRAISAGVDSVVVDGAKLEFEGNVSLASAAVKYARAAQHDVVIEGELGYIGTSSKQMDALPEGVTDANIVTVEDAKKFVEATGVDALAPAVGNVHGMLKNAANPKLRVERVKEIADATGVPLVLHGASGVTDEDVVASIKAGIVVVHINTELRVAYRDALRDATSGDETTPYKFLDPAVNKMKDYITQKLLLFAGK